MLLQAQNHAATAGDAGQHLALNVVGEKEGIKRGDWLTELAPCYVSDRLTVRLENIQPLKESSAVHIYHYASHTTGKLSLLNVKQVGYPQESHLQAVRLGQIFAEIQLETPLHICVGDRLILRTGDDSQTLAGAEVLEIDSPRRCQLMKQRCGICSIKQEN
ncbi:hypothetical protein A4A71_06150 [Nicoletella semolina]|nr:hypothetical protein [Nicoletella semolina]